MLVYSLFCGIFVGGYNGVSVIAVLDCVGQEKLAKALGFHCFTEGLGLCIGSPLAGNCPLIHFHSERQQREVISTS